MSIASERGTRFQEDPLAIIKLIFERRAQRLTESQPSSGEIKSTHVHGCYGSMPKLRRRSFVVSLDLIGTHPRSTPP